MRTILVFLTLVIMTPVFGLMVIIAGYDDEIDRFLASNEALGSRVPRRIRFAWKAARMILVA